MIQRTFDRGGNVVIPSFAVGRTQEMLYFIRKIKADHMIQGHDGFPVFVDSPLAVGATTIFNEHHKDCFDEEAMELVNKGINPITFPGLKLPSPVKNPNPSTLMTARRSLSRPVVCAMPVGSSIT